MVYEEYTPIKYTTKTSFTYYEYIFDYDTGTVLVTHSKSFIMEANSFPYVYFINLAQVIAVYINNYHTLRLNNKRSCLN